MKPLIFSVEMVKAIVDGRKTQTRRVLLPQPDKKIKYGERIYNWRGYKTFASMDVEDSYHLKSHLDYLIHKKCLKYQIEDVLWVREAFQYIKDDDGRVWGYNHKEVWNNAGIDDGYGWKSPYHMPKEAARIFLKVTNVRVERLQDITEDDCYSEGIIPFERKHCGACSSNDCNNPIGYFKYLWDKLNKKRGYGWEANPLVYVIEFERIKQGVKHEFHNKY